MADRHNDGHNYPPIHGSPAEVASYARHEVGDAFVESSDEPLQPMQERQAQDAPNSNNNSYNNNSNNNAPGHDSITSIHSFLEGDTLDPSYLYGILEDALPKIMDAGHGGALSATEQQQKRDQAEQTWDRIRKWLWEHPHLDERRSAAYVRGQADATCLHLMCKVPNPPEDVIQAVVEAAEDVASWADSQGWLPLHHACAYGASPEVLKILIDAYPDGKLRQDKQQRTPLHFYVTRSSDSIAAMTANAEMLSDTGASELCDTNGMLPMHYACAYGTHPAVLHVLADVYPGSLTAKENHGRTPVRAHADINSVKCVLAIHLTVCFLFRSFRFVFRRTRTDAFGNGERTSRRQSGYDPVPFIPRSVEGDD